MNRSTWDEASRLHIERVVEQSMEADEVRDAPRTVREVLGPILPRKKQTPMLSVKAIISKIAGTDGALDAPGHENPLRLLQRIPMRYLQFHEDVRPPYIGTYTKPVPRRLARNPLARLRPDTDYDDDSEAEWEEPEEGEDIDIDDESDGEAPSEMDDMEGFLDDEDDGQPVRKKLLATDLEPISSGICFEDGSGFCYDESGVQVNSRLYKLEILLGRFYEMRAGFRAT